MTTPATDRVKRLCDVCGKLDTEPRHVNAVGPDFEGAVPDNDFLRSLPDGTPALAVAELMDPTTVVRHHACCAQRGCVVCQEITRATGHVTGDELLAKLLAGDADHVSTTDNGAPNSAADSVTNPEA